MRPERLLEEDRPAGFVFNFVLIREARRSVAASPSLRLSVPVKDGGAVGDETRIWTAYHAGLSQHHRDPLPAVSGDSALTDYDLPEKGVCKDRESAKKALQSVSPFVILPDAG